MNFVAIDFETATADRDSPCEIGLTFVENNQIVHTQSWLIKPRQYPYFDSFNVYIHGIRPADVADQPTFDELWVELKPHLENQLVIAHNASFDLSVLRKTLETYQIPFPNLHYSCSYQIAKRAWPGLLSYNLKALCQHHGISLKNHHRAGADSLGCAQLALKVLQQADVQSVDEFPHKLKTQVGKLFEGGYFPGGSSGLASQRSRIVGDPNKHQPGHVFYGKSVVFTGTLSSMGRAQAQQIIADIGGINTNVIHPGTHFLIVGQKSYRAVGASGMSSKQAKAQQLLANGAAIEVLSEDDFLKTI